MGSGGCRAIQSFAYLPVNLGYMFGPLVGSLITRSDVFLVFPAAFGYTACSLLVLYYAWKLAVQADAAAQELSEGRSQPKSL